MKNLLIALLLFLLWTTPIFAVEEGTLFTAAIFNHECQLPSNTVTERWEFNKDAVRDILIEYLESKGYEIRNKESGRITIKDDYVFPNKIITLWIEYDVANDANKRAIQPLNNPLVVK